MPTKTRQGRDGFRRRRNISPGSWHLSGRLIVPPNIRLIALPAKCPELNPQEKHLGVHARQLARTGSSNPSTTSSTTAARHGTSLSINPGGSCRELWRKLGDGVRKAA